jgi:hypothetical protein
MTNKLVRYNQVKQAIQTRDIIIGDMQDIEEQALTNFRHSEYSTERKQIIENHHDNPAIYDQLQAKLDKINTFLETNAEMRIEIENFLSRKSVHDEKLKEKVILVHVTGQHFEDIISDKLEIDNVPIELLTEVIDQFSDEINVDLNNVCEGILNQHLTVQQIESIANRFDTHINFLNPY